ncbi:MAG: DNA-binding response regulator [Verrucomicrobia bacterium]|nr:MAG: DNA-binding response regulator [Verrucomicrobiota bacterium]
MKKPRIARARYGKQKVLLVDDHPVVREGLAERINRERDLVVCGEAQNAREALRAVASLQPDIVILDLSLPKGHGLELVKDLRTLHPDLRVVVFSMHDESVFAERALRAGAHGYVMKQEPPERLLVAIRTVLRGDYFISESASSTCLQAFFSRSTKAVTHSVARLSDRELEIFQLIGQGVSTRKIADRLGRSVKTIETHRTRIKEKLAVKSAAELVHRATCWVESDRGTLDAR